MLKTLLAPLRFFTSETGHTQIAAGVAVGLLLGMSPILSPQTLLAVVALLLFRIQIVAALGTALATSLVAYLLDPLFDRAGGAVLEMAGLRPLFTTLYNAPLVPLTRFNNSVVMGAGVVALALSPVVFFVTRALVLKLRAAGETPARGPIRTGFVVPLLIVLVVAGVFFKFFFDATLRRTLEYAGTQVNGAEVNIASLRTNFLTPSIAVRGIQVTDKSTPARNLVQVDSITFRMLWDALLRAKVVVNEASVLGIEAYVPRSRPGYVVPPSPPAQGPTPVERVEQEVVEQTQKQYSGSVLGDAAAMLSGVDVSAQLKNIQASLKSDERIKQLQSDLESRKAAWEGRVKALPQAADVEGYRTRLRALTFNPRNPAELARNVAEGNRMIGEINEKVKLVDQTATEVRAGIESYSRDVAGLEALVQEDIRGLQSRLGLPDIDARAFSQALFMRLVEERLVGVRKYVEMARQYAPAAAPAGGGGATAAPLVPPRRGEGRTYRFPVSTSYPQFWLKHAAVSSQLTALSEYSGNVKGELIDISSDPALTGKPMQLVLQGDFPKQNITGVDARIVADHTKEEPRETLAVKVAGFPVSGFALADTPAVRLGLQQARGASSLDASLAGETIALALTTRFQETRFSLEAGNAVAREFLDGVLKGISSVTVTAAVTGSFREFRVSIGSNLGDQLAAGFVRQLRAKVDEAQGQVRKLVDSRIADARSKLTSEFNALSGNLTKGIDAPKAQLAAVLKEAQDQVRAAPSAASPLNRILGR